MYRLHNSCPSPLTCFSHVRETWLRHTTASVTPKPLYASWSWDHCCYWSLCSHKKVIYYYFFNAIRGKLGFITYYRDKSLFFFFVSCIFRHLLSWSALPSDERSAATGGADELKALFAACSIVLTLFSILQLHQGQANVSPAQVSPATFALSTIAQKQPMWPSLDSIFH